MMVQGIQKKHSNIKLCSETVKETINHINKGKETDTGSVPEEQWKLLKEDINMQQ